MVEQFGRRTLCLSENPVANRAHFVQAYQDLAARKRDADHCLTIVTRFIARLQTGSYPQLTDGEPEEGE